MHPLMIYWYHKHLSVIIPLQKRYQRLTYSVVQSCLICCYISLRTLGVFLYWTHEIWNSFLFITSIDFMTRTWLKMGMQIGLHIKRLELRWQQFWLQTADLAILDWTSWSLTKCLAPEIGSAHYRWRFWRFWVASLSPVPLRRTPATSRLSPPPSFLGLEGSIRKPRGWWWWRELFYLGIHLSRSLVTAWFLAAVCRLGPDSGIRKLRKNCVEV